ncbi:MAG: DUF2849 domain-containing protein [Rhodospirillales bacterium CG15_BIG_FIL_POST_REV_8_21_14_020_66_15]|nr:MAG: DUF2849 domain-containing protein [Rhodospirillales bacterium CG15_BIG_FIL_POST_REV_8_21_14_020_66_15]
MVQQVVTGNRLSDGLVIFLGEDGGWTPKIDLARVAGTEDEAGLLEDLAKAAEKARLVVAPYLIEVTEDAGTLKPVRYRERLRAYGPSVHPEFGRSDVPDHFRMGVEAAGEVDMAGVAG